MTEPDPGRPLGLPQFRGDNVAPPKAGRRWLPLVGDIALAVGLLVLDAIGTVVAFLIGIDYSGWKPFDPGADNSGIRLTPNWLYVGIAGGVILLTGALLYRLGAVVSACLQVLVAVVVVLVAVAGAQFDEEHGGRADASVSGHAAASHR